MAGLCKDVESHFLANDLEACRSVIGRIFRNIGESSSSNQQSSRDWFVYCGGDTLFIRILSSPFANSRETGREGSSTALTAGAAAGSDGGGRVGGGSRNRRGIFRTESAEGSRESGTLREGETSREETALWMMRNDCLAVLREMCFASACFSEGLSVQRQFLIRLFALMENKITFDYGTHHGWTVRVACRPATLLRSRLSFLCPSDSLLFLALRASRLELVLCFPRLRPPLYPVTAVALAEEILAVGEETLNLGSVPNFARLVRGLSARQLSFFCRVLAMVVFEPEDRAPEVSALQKGADPAERAEREAEWAVADGNHDVLLAIPDILANLVKLLQMESSGEADLWSPSLSEWQPLLGDLMAGEDETAADWGPEEDDEEDYNEDGEEYEEEEEQEEDEEVEEEVEEVEEEVDMEGELLEEDEDVEAEAEGEGEGEEGEEGEGSGFYEDVEEEIAGEDDEEGGEGEERREEGEVEEGEEVHGGGSRSGGERQGTSTHSTGGGSGGNGGGREAEGSGGGRGAAQGASESAGAVGGGGDGGAEASGAAARQAGRGNLWGGFGLFGGIGGLRPGGAAREGRGGAGEGGEEQEPGPDGGGGAVAVSQRRTGAAVPVAGVAPRGAADTTQGPFSPRSPPVAAPPPRMPPLLPPSPHAAVLPFSPHPTLLTGTSTSPPRPPPNRTPPTATQPGALPQVNTTGIPMTANPLNLLPLTAPANPAAAATAAEAAGAGIPAGARVMVFVGNPPRLLGEVPEGELEPFLRALPQGAVTVLRAGEIGLPEGAGPAAVATNMAASFMEQQVSGGEQQVEVLFVLCALCGGKRKEAVQDQLAALGLVGILVDSFDRLNWSAPLPPPAEPHGIHGPGCSCNPESALKIQYLRLIHNFCDRDGPNLHNKLLLASPGGVPPPLAAGTPPLIAAPGIAASVSTLGSMPAGGVAAGGAGGGGTISGGSSSSSGSSGGVDGRVQGSTQGEGNAQGRGQGEGEGEEHGYALGFGASLGRALGFSPNQWLPGLGIRDGAGDSGVLPQAVGVGASRGEGSSAQAAACATEAAAAAGAGGVVEGGAGKEGKNEALMLKIIRVLMKESADSVYRFWLASCVEAFLRGSNPRDQQLVAATGLMEHLVEEILRGASGFKCAASLQIDFDLLGELVKFNPVLFRRLAALVQGERFSRFIEVLVAHLVDSNVFIRSVMLSLHAFRTALPTPPYLGPCPTPALPPPVLSPAIPSTSAAPSLASSSSSPAPDLRSSSAASAAACGEEEAKKESRVAADGTDADAGGGGSGGDGDGGDANSSSGEGTERRGREREEESALKGTPRSASPRGVAEASSAAEAAADRKGKKKVEEGGRSAERGSAWEAKGKAKGKGVMGEGSAVVGEEEEELASPLAAFMECNSVLLLRDLMLVVRLGDINQDNICVLNTALIFFIFANRNAQLLSLLSALRAADKAQPASLAASTTLLQPSSPSSPANPSSPSPPSSPSSPSSRSPSFFSKPPSSALINPSLLPDPVSSNSEDLSTGVGPGSVMKNFRALLDFWREYYLRKRGRDCASLQFSTNIPFTEWLRVVEMLCASPDCPTSLLYCPPLPASGSQCSSVGLRVDPPPRRC
ncbi:unnamed protein product [Closterium sp. NIES-65]|nr:unnamed protein product [Closterium sp. NIES-65]